jgi:predicted amidohydrolase YtcJ
MNAPLTRPSRRRRAPLLLAAVLCAAHAGAAPPTDLEALAPKGPADLILTGGRVRTPAGGFAEALAVRQGTIVAVGTDAAVGRLRGPKTRVVALAGATVLPGFHDVHVHPLFAGLMARRCTIEQGASAATLKVRVAACVAKAKPGAWIMGGQWDAPALGASPHRSMLDEVSNGHPVILEDTSGHSLLANSAALAAAGVTRDTPNPPGGIIERDGSGEPTGLLRESSALELVESHLPKPTVAETEAALSWALAEMASKGITSFTEASVGFSAGYARELEAYAALADRGVLKQRAQLCIAWAPGRPEGDAALAARNLYRRAKVDPDCVKIFLDGVPTESHTAAMLEPYVGTVEGRDDAASRYGLLLVPQAALNAAVTRFDREGLVVKFHAAGDAAVRAGLNAIEAARKANGPGPKMHDVGHCTFVAREDIARARAIGATFEVSPYLWGPSPINDAITAAVAPEVIARVWPVREMIDSGALVVPGSDWSVVPSVDPWIAVETLVTRERPGGSADSYGKQEAITLPEAIDLFTVNAARQRGIADRVGRIEPGMLADVIVVDRNPYETPARQLHETRVRMTFVGGELVYDAARAPRPAAR